MKTNIFFFKSDKLEWEGLIAFLQSLLNTMKKFLTLFVVLAVLLCQIPILVSAEENDEAEKNESVEIVFLFDVSDSMITADPVNPVTGSRITIEAAQQFVFNYPSETSMKVKVIPFNGVVYEGFAAEDVSTKDGMRAYMNNIQSILDDSKTNDTVPGILCWNGHTATGEALEAAEKHLSQSSADKKAVVLFADGDIHLPPSGGLSRDEVIAQSHDKAVASRDSLEAMGAPIYCVGLNVNNSVNEEFLKSISDSEKTNGRTVVVTSAGELTGVFQEIYTYLFEDSLLDTEFEEIQVSPDVVEEKSIRIFGQAVREANISLVSTAPLRTLKVTSPSGVVVAEVDFTADRFDVDEKFCAINATSSKSTANIKLINPMDGDWTLSITGERSTVVVSKIYLFDLILHDSIEHDRLYVGNEYKFDTTIYNKESNSHVSSPALYEGETGAIATASVYNTATSKGDLINGTLNASKNGYDFAVTFDKPGTYEFHMIIKHAQFKIEATKTVEVMAPVLAMALQEGSAESGTKTINVSMFDPLTYEVVSAPSYLNGSKIKFQLLSGENVVTEKEFAVEDMTNGTYLIEFAAPASGSYTAKASLAGYGVSLTSEDVEVTIDPSTISQNGDLPEEIVEKGMSAEFKSSYDLNDIFTDSDGDALTYEIAVGDEDIVSAEIDDGELVIKSKDFGETEITLTVRDGKGAEATYTIDITYKSIMGLIIGIIIAVVVLVIAIVVFLIIVNKRKVIRFGFRVKVIRNDEGKYSEAVYNVNRLASNRHAKPTMALNTLLSSQNTFAQLLSSDIDEGMLDALVSGFGDITVTGQPFKRAFNVAVKGKKKGTFIRSQIRVELADINCSVIFGSVNDFNSMDGYGF